MNRRTVEVKIRYYLIAILCITMLIAPTGVMARPLAAPLTGGPWWETTPEDEVPSSGYDSILYSEIAPKLREIEVNSNRVQVEVIGQSAGGRNLFLVTVSAPEAMGRLGQYQALRQQMLKDPERAQEMVDQFGDFKVPFYIHGSVHGDEYPGVDAAIRLIETLAYDDSEEVQMILDNVILLVNVVANPDGRVMGIRYNANGFDLNRDFITLSQPETRATVRVFTEWNPMVVLDLHGFIDPMLIEPCTPPHNPNYEYDLYIQWAYDQAKAMEAELIAQTEETEAIIPIRDWPDEWDDWPPIFTPMYAMYHGAYGHTLETPYDDDTGVDAHYAAVWGALRFASENREGMIRDQIEVFRRGFLELPQVGIPQEILDELGWDQYNDLTIMDFPAAYVIPADAPLQQNAHEAARLVDFLLFNDVQVEQASQAFTLEGVDYPAGTYVVWMDQPKRGLANTILWAGWDISYDPGLTMYDISGWSHPLLWGVSQAVMDDNELDLKTHTINGADAPQGSVEGGEAGAYAYLPTSNTAIKATNDLLARGVTLYRSESPFTDSGRDFGAGTFILPAGEGQSIVNELANQYRLDVYALSATPEGATLMRTQRIALFDTGPGVGFALKELGFDYDMVYKSDLSAGMDLSGYDVFVNDYWWWRDLNRVGKASFADFLEGGGDYIGIGPDGIRFAKEARLLTFRYEAGSWADNGVLKIDYIPTDPVAAQYPEDGHAFVYPAAWFTSLGDGIEVSASIDAGDFFVSGYWPRWERSGAAGKPIILHGAIDLSEVTLMGINPTFRAHPEHTFRILANAIYNGLD